MKGLKTLIEQLKPFSVIIILLIGLIVYIFLVYDSNPNATYTPPQYSSPYPLKQSDTQFSDYFMAARDKAKEYLEQPDTYQEVDVKLWKRDDKNIEIYLWFTGKNPYGLTVKYKLVASWDEDGKMLNAVIDQY